MKLCRDPVAEVRNSSGMQLLPILKRIDQLNVSWRDEFIEELQDLATDRLFQHRQMFVQMCQTILEGIIESEAPDPTKDVEMFKKDLLPQLLVLAEDKVANIRHRVGICFQMLNKIKGLSSDAAIKTALASLTQDKDVEVLRTMGLSLQLGLTSSKHLGLSNGAERDAEVRKANTV